MALDASVSSTCHFVRVFPYQPERTAKQPQVPQAPLGFPPLEKDWLCEFETFPSADERATLFSHLFRPLKPDARLRHKALMIFHGQSEHSGRYVHVPHYVKDTVGSVYALDHRGHGRSTGIWGHVPHFDRFADDLALAVRRYHNFLTQEYGEAEIHLLGHSMGGLITLRALLLYPNLPIASVTLSAPMLELAFKVPKLKEMAGRMFYRFFPFLPLPTEPMDQIISRDKNVVFAYQRDPYNHGLASSGFYFTYLEVLEDTLARGAELAYPILLQLPMRDQIINSKATEAFYRTWQGSNKKLIPYDDLFHEIYNEPEKPIVFGDLIEWIKAHSTELPT